MESDQKIPVPVLLGPTASGKTAVAVRIAQELDISIISCDSRQVYRCMDIGTAKPSPEHRALHCLIDYIDPSESYSAFRFVSDAGKLIRDYAKAGRRVMICGGTGMYFQALAEGLGPQLPSNPHIRVLLEQRAEREGSLTLHDELRLRDPQTAAAVHPNDLQRILRALTVVYQNGTPLSQLKKKTVPPDDIDFTVLVLTVDRTQLYKRIGERVDRMIAAGLWEEFKTLRSMGYDACSPGMQCVGYKELFDVENGTMSMAQALDLIKQNTRRYAKRQSTWFTNKTKGAIAVDPASCDERLKRFFERE